jgi:Mor family transcriptional regulator
MKDITYEQYKAMAADRRRRILAMHENGVPVVELAALYAVSEARIYKIIETAKRERATAVLQAEAKNDQTAA